MFSCLLPNIAHQSPLAGPSPPAPQLARTWGSRSGRTLGKRGGRGAGRQAGRGARAGGRPSWLGPALPSVFGAVLPSSHFCWADTIWACPRILRPASCLSWAHLALSTLPVPPPPPPPSPLEARSQEVRGQRKHAGPTSRRYCFPDEAGGRLSTLTMGSCWGSWVRKVKSV